MLNPLPAARRSIYEAAEAVHRQIFAVLGIDTSNEDICQICTERLLPRTNRSPLGVPGCSHTFHASCLMQQAALTKMLRCPAPGCKAKLAFDDE